MSAGWKQRLLRSLHVCRSQPHARFLQLATVDENGFPDNRTVVFRGFDEPHDHLLVVTDIRSDKIAHLLKNPVFSVAWYFEKTREQYRFNGTAEIRVEHISRIQEVFAQASSSTTVREHDVSTLWKNLSDNAKAQFFWPYPKRPINDSEAVTKTQTVSPFFAVLSLKPDSVQYLDLKPEPQCRELHLRDEQVWQCEAVNP